VTRQANLLVCLLLGLNALGGCDASLGEASRTPSATGAASSPRATNGSPEAGPAAGQTDTSWGRIWDEIPADFPLFPGGAPAGATAEPVSAALAIQGAEPRDVIAWMQTELERAVFPTEGLNGPLEDGSFVLDSNGPDDCRIQVQAAPLGALTSLIVRYGAACPAP
jgi:hypothetical protein